MRFDLRSNSIHLALPEAARSYLDSKASCADWTSMGMVEAANCLLFRGFVDSRCVVAAMGREAAFSSLASKVVSPAASTLTQQQTSHLHTKASSSYPSDCQPCLPRTFTRPSTPTWLSSKTDCFHSCSATKH